MILSYPPDQVKRNARAAPSRSVAHMAVPPLEFDENLPERFVVFLDIVPPKW